MKFSCDRCQTRYQIPDEKVRPGGVKVRCKKCEHIIVVRRQGIAPSAVSTAGGGGPAGEAPKTNGAPRQEATVSAGAAQPGPAQRSLADGTAPARDESLEDELGAAFESMVVGKGHPAVAPSAQGGDDAGGDEEGHGASRGDQRQDERSEQRGKGGAAHGEEAAVGGSPGVPGAPAETSAQGAAAPVVSQRGTARIPTTTLEAGALEAPAASAAAGSGSSVDASSSIPKEGWFLAIEEEQVGPMSLSSLCERWEGGEVGPDTLCWRAGLLEWTPLSQVDELGAVLAPLPRVQEGASLRGTAPKQEPWEQTEKSPASARDEGWRPSAGSKLASLVEKELEAAKAPDELAAPASDPEEDPLHALENTGIRRLIRDLPEAPPAEASRFIPLSRSSRGEQEPAQQGARERPAGVAAEPKRPKRRIVYAVAAVALCAPLLALGAWLGGAFEFGTRGEGGAKVDEAPAPPLEPLAAGGPGQERGEGASLAEAEKAAEAAGEEAGDPAAAQVAATDAEAGVDTATAKSDDANGEAAETEGPAKTANVKEAKAAPAVQPKAEVASAPPPRPAPPIARRPPSGAAPQPRAAPTPKPPPSAPPARSNDLLAAGSRSSIDDLFEKEFASGGQAKQGSTGGSYIPPAPGGGAALPAQLSQGDITGVVFAQKDALKRCATEYKSSGGASSGTLVMRWTIEKDGRTSGVQPIKGTEHEELATCIGGLVRGWRFPAYSGPKMPAIDFPFPF